MKAAKIAEGTGSKDENSDKGGAPAKKKTHLKTFFKEEEDKTSKKEQSSVRVTIPSGGMADTVELEELQKQASSNKKVGTYNIRTRTKHSAKHSKYSFSLTISAHLWRIYCG